MSNAPFYLCSKIHNLSVQYTSDGVCPLFSFQSTHLLFFVILLYGIDSSVSRENAKFLFILFKHHTCYWLQNSKNIFGRHDTQFENWQI